MIIRAAVTCSNLKNLHNIAKNHLQSSATPTSTTTDAKALKFLPDTMQVLKNLQCERFVNQIKIDRMMSNHLSSFNMHQFKIITNFHFDY